RKRLLRTLLGINLHVCRPADLHFESDLDIRADARELAAMGTGAIVQTRRRSSLNKKESIAFVDHSIGQLTRLRRHPVDHDAKVIEVEGGFLVAQEVHFNELAMD